ncbi:hypothetical protein KQ878_00880 [Mycoplasma zalophidermidis]|uniref:Uncharacterized protein n=1 Tax=Mycoplasma zalophidermidis TaxID=398174 RepID=A0ABS6DS81_9MOLU|nr:hypothetical protein [Mycoplasma zalophidermidis]MBU4693440.1 hypothetical protein [Mycoplasma zalophidermidis]
MSNSHKKFIKTNETGVWVNIKVKDPNFLNNNENIIKNQIELVCEKNSFEFIKLRIVKQSKRTIISLLVDDVKYGLKLALYFQQLFLKKTIDIQQYAVQKWEFVNEET